MDPNQMNKIRLYNRTTAYILDKWRGYRGSNFTKMDNSHSQLFSPFVRTSCYQEAS